MNPIEDKDETRRFGERVDFGRTASDYRRFRAGFPDAFFVELAVQQGLQAGQTALDLGTGTGTVARGLARLGLRVTGIDPAPALLREAAELDAGEGLDVDYREGRAEDLPFARGAFDIVTAGQCWHWFDRPRAAAEAYRVLKPDGALAIAHFDWLPTSGNVVEATERLILDANPSWTMAGGTGLHPAWLADLAGAGFTALRTRSFDVDQLYTHEAWRGRIRASAGVKASLDEAAIAKFDALLRDLLRTSFPASPLVVPHRVWWVSGKR